jgi:hypothetical protein
MDDGPLHIRFRPIDLSSLGSTKENRTRAYSSVIHSKHKGEYFCLFFSFEIVKIILIDYFNSLSDELILSILKYLPRASLASMAQVCRRLRSLT